MQLIAGPGVYICDECIEVCYTLLEGEHDPHAAASRRKKSAAPAEEVKLPTPAEIKAKLDEYVIGQ